MIGIYGTFMIILLMASTLVESAYVRAICNEALIKTSFSFSVDRLTLSMVYALTERFTYR
jgi:hypothetical protein